MSLRIRNAKHQAHLAVLLEDEIVEWLKVQEVGKDGQPPRAQHEHEPHGWAIESAARERAGEPS